MKMIKISIVSVITLAALASCKKDYTCNCSAGGYTVVAETYTSVTKSDAESKCGEYEAEAKLVVPDASCSTSKK